MVLVTRSANQGNLYNQETEPPDWLDGDVWVKTSTGLAYTNVSGTATEISTPPTEDTNIEVNGVTLTLREWLFST